MIFLLFYIIILHSTLIIRFTNNNSNNNGTGHWETTFKGKFRSSEKSQPSQLEKSKPYTFTTTLSERNLSVTRANGVLDKPLFTQIVFVIDDLTIDFSEHASFTSYARTDYLTSLIFGLSKLSSTRSYLVLRGLKYRFWMYLNGWGTQSYEPTTSNVKDKRRKTVYVRSIPVLWEL